MEPKTPIDVQLKIEPEVHVLTSGLSMYPMLYQHRDMVVIRRSSGKHKKGDVVLYPNKKGDQFILHRIVRVRKNDYVLRGDNNYFTEYGITEKDIIGELKEFYRDGKYIDCATNRKYKRYTFYICHSYWWRYAFKIIICPILRKIKHFIIKK